MKQTTASADRTALPKAPFSQYNPNAQIYSRNGCPLRTNITDYCRGIQIEGALGQTNKKRYKMDSYNKYYLSHRG